MQYVIALKKFFLQKRSICPSIAWVLLEWCGEAGNTAHQVLYGFIEPHEPTANTLTTVKGCVL